MTSRALKMYGDDIRSLEDSISYLVEISHGTAVEKGWHDDGIPPVNDQLLLCVTEVAEAAEQLREGRAPNELYYRADGKPEGVPAELADVVIRIAHLCGAHNIDLAKAVVEKLKFNMTRPHKHGGKKF